MRIYNKILKNVKWGWRLEKVWEARFSIITDTESMLLIRKKHKAKHLLQVKCWKKEVGS